MNKAPIKTNDGNIDIGKPAITFNMIWLPVIILPMIIIPICYVMYHDTSVDFEHDLRSLSTCESMKNFLDNDGRKIMKFELRASVEKIYAEKGCK